MITLRTPAEVRAESMAIALRAIVVRKKHGYERAIGYLKRACDNIELNLVDESTLLGRLAAMIRGDLPKEPIDFRELTREIFDDLHQVTKRFA